MRFIPGALGIMSVASTHLACNRAVEKPNIVIIYADDLGYGDISCYGAASLTTHNIDRFANQGLRFTNAHCTSATSTPSRYSLLTGEYAWRRRGTGIAAGDAAAIIGDRVPCVYVENRRIVGLDPNDPITVNYREKVGDWPTGKENPELLKMHPSHGHDMTIVNGISRIGYMNGGKSALWVDEEMADVITSKAVKFIEENREKPFFLYFATHDIHVPRVPHQRFAGKSGMGPRGDAILEFDWSVGEIIKTIDNLKLSRNTIIIVTSDNGPVVDDGYKDEAVEKLGDHKPAGPLRGGKYSAFDGGTRIAFIVRWTGKIKPGVTDALFSQIDLLSSFASLTGQSLDQEDAPDSFNNLNTLLGKSETGREWVVEQAANSRLSLINGDWKYIEPGSGPRVSANTNIELGNDTLPQLYNLRIDLGEQDNVAQQNPGILNELTTLLQRIKEEGRTR